MYKSILFGFAMLISVTSMVIMAPNSARSANAGAAYTIAEDNVFIDEGDGDFAVPSLPPAKAEHATEAAAKPAPAAVGSVDELETTANLPLPDNSAPVELGKSATETSAKLEEAPKAEAPAVAEVKEEPKEEKPVAPKAEKKAKSAKKKVAKAAAPKASGAKGKFVNTQKACPMLREPASESEKMITVKASRKIWVEEVDASWVRAFNRKGEPGYVATDCVQ